jgi:hypothetical protein
VLQAFVFNELAITVRHWYEVGEVDEEHGTRIEVRTLNKHPHRGSESAAQRVDLDGIVWRFDLFDLIGKEPGNFERAHYHCDYEDLEPPNRSWDEALRADPFGWTEARLRDVAALAANACVTLEDGEEENADVRRHLPAIMAAARSYAPTECTSPERCMEWTRDLREVVLLMSTNFRPEDPASPGDPRILGGRAG